MKICKRVILPVGAAAGQVIRTGHGAQLVKMTDGKGIRSICGQ